ncbi:MAG: peptidase S41 [Bacteroidetes bacterium]|nr:MAG: peptidase S41 [Bacteroidota bacterium]
MKLLLNYFICFAFVNIALLNGQTPEVDYNFDFEKINPIDSLPVGIYPGEANYKYKIDSVIKQHGKYSISIESFREKVKSDSNDYGAFSFIIPSKFTGKNIILKGWLKTENVSNSAGFWIDLESSKGQIAFEDMSSQVINGTNDWKQYSISLPFSDSTIRIVFGGLINGTGKIWVDNIEILIDSVEITKAKEKEIIYKAELDSEFINGSGIEKLKSDKNTIDNLYTLGLVWGYLKYYHPSIAKGNFNWDFELFRNINPFLKCKNKNERCKYIIEWIDKLGNIETSSNHINIDSARIKFFPDLGWLSDTTLFTKELVDKLYFIYENRNQSEHYYFGITSFVGNPIFKNENSYINIQYSDVGLRILCLFRYWNIIQYLYPYKYAIGEDWKNVLKEFLPKFINADEELSYKLAILELIGRVHDTHANIWGIDSTISEFKGKLYSSIEIKFIEDKPVVTGIFNDSLRNLTNLDTGDIILSVDNESVEYKIKRMMPYYPASNYTTQLRDIARNFLRSNKDSIKIEYYRDGKTSFTFVKLYSPEHFPINFRYKKIDTCFKFITPDIGYIYPGKIKNDYLSGIMEAVKNTKGIIIDLRCYPSEFIVFSLGEYLFPKPNDFAKFTCTQINNPGMFIFTEPVRNGKENPEFYKGKIVIIINETTQSQAEYTAMALRNAPNATVIGSTTAGADGNVSAFYLPGNIYSMISGIGVYYPDGRETQRVGIVPDIEVKLTIKGIREGRDEVLEKAIEIINKN